MTMRVNRSVGIATAAILLCACTATGGGNAGDGATRADQNRLVLTIVTGEGFPVEAEGFAEAVAEASGGSIEVKVDNATLNGDGIADYETRVIDHVSKGNAELGFVAARAFDTVGVDAFVPLHAPFLIDSYELEAEVLRSASVQALLDGTRSAGVVGIGYVQGPLRRPLGYSRALLEAADYDGARIGVRESTLIEATMESLGATADVFPPGDTTGLDGMEIHVGQIELGKYDSGADSLTGNVVFWPRPGVIFANVEAFDALTPDQQAILREAGARNLEDSVAELPPFEMGFLDSLCTRGLAITMASDGAIDDLRGAVQSVYNEIEADVGAKTVIDAIEALRASVNAPVGAVECNVAAATPLPSQVIDSPIVGTWTVSFTKDEFQSSPLITDAGERNDPQNWGDFTLTFSADGRVTVTLAPPLPYSASGDYVIEGDHLVMRFDEGLLRGATFGGGWSIFRDTLTIERLAGEELPTWYVIKAWTRSP
jgi:TRAP-type C4-dicarboxylate transport system substrate-binding protein